jgi:hypothetical protein
MSLSINDHYSAGGGSREEMIKTDPCNEDCENYGMCYELCSKKIVYEKLYINFGGFKLSITYGSSVWGRFTPEFDLIELNPKYNRWAESTLSHEIEHALLHHISRRFGCNEKQANFVDFFVSKPSDGDNQVILDSTLHCGECNKLLTEGEKEQGFTLDDGETWLCVGCEELYHLGLLDQSGEMN